MGEADDEEASLLALLSGMDDENKREEEALLAGINSITEPARDEESLLLEQLKGLGDAGGGEDEASDLEKRILAMPDDDDLEAMVNALSDDDDGPEVSVESLQRRVREAKLAEWGR